MKLAEHANKLETNATPVSQNFGIGDASVIIEILRNRLYEHKIRTLVQEYLCNGRDAQRESGATRKIEVTVPNGLNPSFKVRDFGLGITPDRMANVFVLYGASTKRSTNTQTGGFGIGAKSAWSYTDSFNIITHVDGVKRVYVAHTGTNNQGRLDLISTGETSEPNGTEIEIAVKQRDVKEFRDAIYRAIHFWKESERPVIKGVTQLDIPEFYQGYKINDTLYLGDKVNSVDYLPYFNNWNVQALLVIDGVPYSIEDKLAQHVGAIKTLRDKLRTTPVIHVGNGEVEVSASREAIADSEYTRINLQKIVANAGIEVDKYLKAKFKAVVDTETWIAAYRELSRLFNVQDQSKRGNYTIANERIMPTTDVFSKIKITELTARRGNSKVSLYPDEFSFVRLECFDNLFYIDNNDSKVVQNKRIRDYLNANQLHQILVLSASEKKKKTYDPTKKTDIETVVVTLADSEKALKSVVQDLGAKPLSSLPYVPAVREQKTKEIRTKEMFIIHEFSNWRKSHKTATLESVATRENKYLYIPLDQYDALKDEMFDIKDFIAQDGYDMCALTDKVIAMIKEVGSEHFIPYKDWKKDFKATKKMLEGAKYQKAKNKRVMDCLAKAGIKIKDKHLAKMVDEYAYNVKNHYEMALNQKMPETLIKWITPEIKDFLDDDTELKTLLKDKYSLAETYAEYISEWRMKKSDSDELVLYINSKV